MPQTTKPLTAPLAHALEAIGDPWSFLILQEAFFGERRFSVFQANLGIAKNTLTERLNRLVDHQVLFRREYQERPPRWEYLLTKSGLDTYSYSLGLMAWGDKWLAGVEGPPVTLYHKTCGVKLHQKSVCGACSREVHMDDISMFPAIVREPPAPKGGKVRYSSRPELYTTGRTTSVGRTLAVIGDRWGFYIMWLACSGVTRFDHFQKILGISRTVLTVRLDRFVKNDILERQLYQDRPPRSGYHLTPKGEDLGLPVLLLHSWGQRWFGEPEMIEAMHKSCGQAVKALMVCDNCHAELTPQDVRIETNNNI